jgi:uncharacterized damage-inducible protein DinB
MPLSRIIRRTASVPAVVALASAVIVLALTVAAALVLFPPALAQETSAFAGKIVGVKEEMLAWIQDAEGKLIELAKAVPEDKYHWSPDKGVRTFGEVFMHVAAANLGLPDFVGVPAPSGFDFGGYEHSLTKKDDIVKALQDSFAHMEAGLKGMTPEQMDTPAEFFGMKTTRRGAYMLLLSHAHEHLGQAIAYARMNKITPPWTAREEAAAKAADAKKAAEPKKPAPPKQP